MSLRTKLLGLFALLAVLPLVGMGLFNYLQSLRALESLVAGQAAMFADRAATELADRYSIVDAMSLCRGVPADPKEPTTVIGPSNTTFCK